MTTAVFDTLAHCKKLKAAGFTEQQAEVQAEAIAEIIDEKLATKKDLLILEENLKRDMRELEEKLSYKLTMRLGSMLVAVVSILAIIIKLH